MRLSEWQMFDTTKVNKSGRRVILYLFAEIKYHNCYYSVCMNILIFMLPNYQARLPFVLKHTTSIYVCMYGLYVCLSNARGGFSPKTRLIRLDPSLF